MEDLDFAGLLEQVGIAVLSMDAQGSIRYASQAVCRIFGYSCEELVGQHVTMLMPERVAGQHDAHVLRFIKTGNAHILGMGRQVEGKRADGTVVPVHISVGRIDVGGEIRFTAIILDLTDQQQMLDKMSRFGRIIDESINEIFVFRADTLKFTLVNRGALANLGYELDEMLNMTPVDLKPEFDEAEFRKIIAPLVVGKCESVAFQTRHLRRDHSQYDADVTLHLAGKSEPLEIIAIIQDCTERNRMLKAVQQSQKMDAIVQLTGGIAHDFNNLLTVINGNLELLEMEDPGEEDMELIVDARVACSRAADLTERLLSFACLNILQPSRLNINFVILDMSDLMQNSVGGNITIQTLLTPHIRTVKVDESQLYSALLNLTMNARDAMPEGGTLILETRNRSLDSGEAESLELPAGDYVELRVSDNGEGIEPDQLDNIFEPFYTTRLQSRNRGLGLSMVYGFARQSGGILSVVSQKGRGSTFSLLLPEDISVNAAPADTVVDTEEKIGGITILLVEDEEGVRRLTSRRLLHMGHTVFEAADVDEALSKFDSHPEIQLLFTDMVMPGEQTGMDLAKTVQRIKPDLPVIISSGYSEQLNGSELDDLPNFLSLGKPYGIKELRDMITRAINLKVTVNLESE